MLKVTTQETQIVNQRMGRVSTPSLTMRSIMVKQK